MAIDPTQEIAFTVDDVAALRSSVAEVLTSGRGWLNLAPDVEPGVEPPRRNLFAAIFTSRGPALPLATIGPAGTEDGGLALGLQHAGGARAVELLRSAGHPLPEGWRRVSDHPRRGLVLSAPADSDPDEVVRWLIDAARVLTEIDLDEGWVARVYRS